METGLQLDLIETQIQNFEQGEVRLETGLPPRLTGFDSRPRPTLEFVASSTLQGESTLQDKAQTCACGCGLVPPMDPRPYQRRRQKYATKPCATRQANRDWWTRKRADGYIRPRTPRAADLYSPGAIPDDTSGPSTEGFSLEWWPYKRLAAKVIVQAVEDAQKPIGEGKAEALRFLTSEREEYQVQRQFWARFIGVTGAWLRRAFLAAEGRRWEVAQALARGEANITDAQAYTVEEESCTGQDDDEL